MLKKDLSKKLEDKKQVASTRRKTNDEALMKAALQEAQLAAAAGEIPIGAIVVAADGIIIARAHNLRETQQDATAHAEILAIRAACRQLESWRLSGCTLYVTVEPCPMCSGAIVNSRLKRVVYGCADSKAGAAESIFNIVSNPYLNHRAAVTAGVLEAECAAIIADFFRQRRLDK